MKYKSLHILLTCVLVATASLQAAEPTTRSWTVDGVERTALICAPNSAKSEPSPLLFAYHGHGGTSRLASNRWNYQSEWPEAVVVYPQGLNTPGRLVDREGKQPGWQGLPGEQGDRDLKFFDAMLADLKKDYKVDDKRIYVTGHSNGGTFTYVLWLARGKEFTAFAPTAAVIPLHIRQPDAKIDLSKVALRPVLHLAGKSDPLVKFEWQQWTIEAVKKVNHCTEGKPWDDRCTIFPSPDNAPVVTWLYDGEHGLPKGSTQEIVKFFKQFPAPATKP